MKDITDSYKKRLIQLAKQLQEINEKAQQDGGFIDVRNSKLNQLVGFILALED